MNRNDFVETDGYFSVKVNGIEIFISSKEMSDKLVLLAKNVLAEYPKKIAEIAEYISQEKWFSDTYNLEKEEIAAKLRTPVIRIHEGGGLLSFCENEIDSGHILDVYFAGVLEKFYEVAMDG